VLPDAQTQTRNRRPHDAPDWTLCLWPPALVGHTPELSQAIRERERIVDDHDTKQQPEELDPADYTGSQSQPAQPAPLPVPKTAVEMLNLLDRFFCDAESNESFALWQVLTALRGPDDSGKVNKLKSATTERIRTAAFPLCFQRSRGPALIAGFSPDCTLDLSVLDADGISQHFSAHVYDAYFVLQMMKHLKRAPR